LVVRNVPELDLTTVVDAGLLLYDVPVAGLPVVFDAAAEEDEDEEEEEDGPLPPIPELEEVVLVSPL